MSSWPSTKARRVLAALFQIGWTLKRQSGSHKTLSRPGWPERARLVESLLESLRDAPLAEIEKAWELEIAERVGWNLTSLRDSSPLKTITETREFLCPRGHDYSTLRYMTERLRRFAGALGAVLVALSLVVAPAAAQDAAKRADAPPLWKIEGPKSKVFLFGSFHLLPAGVKWRTPAVEKALNAAQVVVVETDLSAAEDPQAMQALIARYGLLPQGQTLQSVLPAKVHADFERTVSGLGLPAAALASVRPWLAAVTVAVQSFVKQGFDPKNGIDQQVAAWAKANGKALTTLETNESQLAILAELPREQEVELLAATLTQIREMPQVIGSMLAAYGKSDIAALERILGIGLDDFPALRDRVLKDRHDKWLPQIEKMIADGRTHFVVVGLAHLVGAESVIAMLRARGVRVEGP